jgi:predicted metal-binding membrane protein
LITRLPRRDLLAIWGSMAVICLLCWWYLFDSSAGMAAGMRVMPAMEGMESMPGMAMGIPAWDGSYALSMFLMWAIMMVGMMLPSVAPTVLIYAGIANKAARDGSPIAPTGLFVMGYLFMWIVFSLLATLLQWQLDEAALLSPMMVSNSAALGAGLLIAAGLYQWLPVKDACLEHCRNPVHFISAHWRKGNGGAVLMGLHHGAYCLGCCWVLMGLLFLGGVMNLLWIAAITVFVLLEKLLDSGIVTSRLAGAAMVCTGVGFVLF